MTYSHHDQVCGGDNDAAANKWRSLGGPADCQKGDHVTAPYEDEGMSPGVLAHYGDGVGYVHFDDKDPPALIVPAWKIYKNGQPCETEVQPASCDVNDFVFAPGSLTDSAEATSNPALKQTRLFGAKVNRVFGESLEVEFADSRGILAEFWNFHNEATQTFFSCQVGQTFPEVANENGVPLITPGTTVSVPAADPTQIPQCVSDNQHPNLGNGASPQWRDYFCGGEDCESSGTGNSNNLCGGFDREPFLNGAISGGLADFSGQWPSFNVDHVYSNNILSLKFDKKLQRGAGTLKITNNIPFLTANEVTIPDSAVSISDDKIFINIAKAQAADATAWQSFETAVVRQVEKNVACYKPVCVENYKPSECSTGDCTSYDQAGCDADQNANLHPRCPASSFYDPECQATYANDVCDVTADGGTFEDVANCDDSAAPCRVLQTVVVGKEVHNANDGFVGLANALDDNGYVKAGGFAVDGGATFPEGSLITHVNSAPYNKATMVQTGGWTSGAVPNYDAANVPFVAGYAAGDDVEHNVANSASDELYGLASKLSENGVLSADFSFTDSDSNIGATTLPSGTVVTSINSEPFDLSSMVETTWKQSTGDNNWANRPADTGEETKIEVPLKLSEVVDVLDAADSDSLSGLPNLLNANGEITGAVTIDSTNLAANTFDVIGIKGKPSANFEALDHAAMIHTTWTTAYTPPSAAPASFATIPTASQTRFGVAAFSVLADLAGKLNAEDGTVTQGFTFADSVSGADQTLSVGDQLLRFNGNFYSDAMVDGGAWSSSWASKPQDSDACSFVVVSGAGHEKARLFSELVNLAGKLDINGFVKTGETFSFDDASDTTCVAQTASSCPANYRDASSDAALTTICANYIDADTDTDTTAATDGDGLANGDELFCKKQVTLAAGQLITHVNNERFDSQVMLTAALDNWAASGWGNKPGDSDAVSVAVLDAGKATANLIADGDDLQSVPALMSSTLEGDLANSATFTFDNAATTTCLPKDAGNCPSNSVDRSADGDLATICANWDAVNSDGVVDAAVDNVCKPTVTIAQANGDLVFNVFGKAFNYASAISTTWRSTYDNAWANSPVSGQATSVIIVPKTALTFTTADIATLKAGATVDASGYVTADTTFNSDTGTNDISLLRGSLILAVGNDFSVENSAAMFDGAGWKADYTNSATPLTFVVLPPADYAVDDFNSLNGLIPLLNGGEAITGDFQFTDKNLGIITLSANSEITRIQKSGSSWENFVYATMIHTTWKSTWATAPTSGTAATLTIAPSTAAEHVVAAFSDISAAVFDEAGLLTADFGPFTNKAGGTESLPMGSKLLRVNGDVFDKASMIDASGVGFHAGFTPAGDVTFIIVPPRDFTIPTFSNLDALPANSAAPAGTTSFFFSTTASFTFTDSNGAQTLSAATPLISLNNVAFSVASGLTNGNDVWKAGAFTGKPDLDAGVTDEITVLPVGSEFFTAPFSTISGLTFDQHGNPTTQQTVSMTDSAGTTADVVLDTDAFLLAAGGIMTVDENGQFVGDLIDSSGSGWSSTFTDGRAADDVVQIAVWRSAKTGNIYDQLPAFSSDKHCHAKTKQQDTPCNTGNANTCGRAQCWKSSCVL